MRISPLFLSLAMLLALPACEDQHVGRICFIQRDIDPNSSSVVVNPQALECPSRLCLHYPKESGVAENVKPLDLCTAECTSDDDCEGETSNQEGTCKEGFKCAWPVQVGPLCCKRLCVCKDLMKLPEDGHVDTPSVCEPNSANQKVCPNL